MKVYSVTNTLGQVYHVLANTVEEAVAKYRAHPCSRCTVLHEYLPPRDVIQLHVGVIT